MRPATLSLTLLFAGLLAWGLWPERAPTDEERIAALVDDGADAASTRDVARLLSHVSPDYQGDFGGRAELQEGLAALLFAMRGAEIRTLAKSTRVTGDAATSEFTVVVVQPQASDGKPLSTQKLRLSLVRRDGLWLVTEARGVDGGGLLP